jgi:hypothetical protein
LLSVVIEEGLHGSQPISSTHDVFVDSQNVLAEDLTDIRIRVAVADKCICNAGNCGDVFESLGVVIRASINQPLASCLLRRTAP